MKFLKQTWGVWLLTAAIVFKWVTGHSDPLHFQFILLVVYVIFSGLATMAVFLAEKRTVRSLAWPLMFLGGLSNGAAMAFNHLKMPVFTTADFIRDSMHVAGTSASRLAPLCDRYNVGSGVASIGDFLLVAGILVWFVAKQKTCRK